MLNDLKYHKIIFKLNAQEAVLNVDGFQNKTKLDFDYKKSHQVQKDNSPLYVGGSPYFYSGYRGVIKKMFIDGVLLDLPKILKGKNLEKMGVFSGSKALCAAMKNPCNFGDCIEHFSHYTCDCSFSPHNGGNCEIESGLTFSGDNNLLTYKLQKNLNVNAFMISISFKTESDGLLYIIQGAEKNIFIILDIFNGNLRLKINLWPYRVNNSNEIRFFGSHPNETLNDNKVHFVKFKLEKNKTSIEIDGFVEYFSLQTGIFSNLILKNPQIVYLGQFVPTAGINSSYTPKFSGCFGGMKMKFKYEGLPNYEIIEVLKLSESSNMVKIYLYRGQ